MGVLIHIPPVSVPIGKDIKPHPLFWPFPQGTLTRILWLSVRGYLNSSVQKSFYFWIEWSSKNKGMLQLHFLRLLLWRFKTWPSLPGSSWKGFISTGIFNTESSFIAQLVRCLYFYSSILQWFSNSNLHCVCLLMVLFFVLFCFLVFFWWRSMKI